MISIEQLLEYDGQFVNYDKGEIVFLENESALYYYQVVSGSLKIENRKVIL